MNRVDGLNVKAVGHLLRVVFIIIPPYYFSVGIFVVLTFVNNVMAGSVEYY